MKQKNKKEDFWVLSRLGASLLGNMLAGKGTIRAVYGNEKGRGIFWADYGSERSLTK